MIQHVKGRDVLGWPWDVPAQILQPHLMFEQNLRIFGCETTNRAQRGKPERSENRGSGRAYQGCKNRLQLWRVVRKQISHLSKIAHDPLQYKPRPVIQINKQPYWNVLRNSYQSHNHLLSTAASRRFTTKIWLNLLLDTTLPKPLPNIQRINSNSTYRLFGESSTSFAASSRVYSQTFLQPLLAGL